MMKNKFRLVLVVIFVALFFIQGCAGRAARPVKVTQSGDVEKNCKVLKIEMRKYRRNIQKKIPSIKAADKKRTLLMLSGGLLIVPWFFLDLSDADKIEANAVRVRHNYLADRAEKLKCRFKVSHLKAFYFHDKGYKKNRNR
jgi:hypothetical protein